MPVKAQLDGHEFDLRLLAEMFPEGDARIEQQDDGYYFEAAALDELFHEAGRMQATATSVLDRLVGIARLRDSGFRPVRLTNRYVNEAGNSHTSVSASDDARTRDVATATVVVAATAEARAGALVAAVAINDGVPTTPEAVGPRYIDLASSNADVAELLALIGSADTLMWNELSKAYEIIRHAVGGGQAGLIAAGWTTKLELSAFTGTANHPAASGTDARHARQSGPPPTQAMTIEEGRQFIRDLADRWFASLQ